MQTAGKPFGGYVRVSRVGERDERLRSPEFQRSAIEAKAIAAGVAVEMFEPELDVSGSKRNRAILDRLVERIVDGELAGVIVYNLSRLSRLKPKDRIELVERIEGAGGTILSASESFDASTPEGRFQRDLFFSIARMQWEQAAEGFHVAKSNAIASGRAVKASAPFGYRFDEHRRHVVEPDEAAIVVELFELRAAGASYGECLARFEEMSGRSSYRESMKYLLENRAYLGELHYGRDPELERYENLDAHPAIVPLELFETVQAVNASRARSSSSTNVGGKARSLLAGIAKCQGCGRGLVRTRTGSRQTYSYKCPADTNHCEARAHIQAAPLEEHVIERVLAWAGPIADEELELELGLDVEAERIVVERRLVEAEAALRRFAGDLELEETDPEAYATGLAARRRRVELRRQELDAMGDASELELVRGSVRTVLVDDEYSVEERRELLASVLSSVIVRRTPSRVTPTADRAELVFAAPAFVSDQNAAERDEHSLGHVASSR